ncbi:hypothetical protein IHQ68_11875 [Chelatococcus sambhunathii]|uniref:Secreted protein n=1 Tax=Chelatococcus sambhunathii TaxID=363953 RepID=A0ABU1DH01_9HYPH|nr:hypothetical protein [Chelatococcus sambhunathii]MDR4307315.1 hypothetical protein [Chelatococcus sambhunathii]
MQAVGWVKCVAGRILALAAVIVGVTALGAATPAEAAIYAIPAPAFVKQCPCGPGTDVTATETRGTIALQNGGPAQFFAAVPFAGSGQVCGFTMIYRDINAAERLTATLLRKTFTVGGYIYDIPVTMAQAVSANGVTNSVRSVSATTIPSPAINTTTGFYYVRIDMQNINMDLLGVQIDIRSAC